MRLLGFFFLNVFHGILAIDYFPFLWVYDHPNLMLFDCPQELCFVLFSLLWELMLLLVKSPFLASGLSVLLLIMMFTYGLAEHIFFFTSLYFSSSNSFRIFCIGWSSLFLGTFLYIWSHENVKNITLIVQCSFHLVCSFGSILFSCLIRGCFWKFTLTAEL